MKRLRRNLLLVLLLVCLALWLWVEWLGRAYREEPYTLIEDRLYAGRSVAEPPPGTRAVLNLCDRKDPYRAEAHFQDVIPDGKAPDLAWLKRMVKFIDDQKRQGHTVFVHCNAGVSRSALVVVAYLMYAHGWERDRALRHARARRPQLQPNIEFLQLLSEWEDVLREEGRLGGKAGPEDPDSQKGPASVPPRDPSQPPPLLSPYAPHPVPPGAAVGTPRAGVPGSSARPLRGPTAVAVAP